MGEEQRPGGWVEGIGWVAMLGDCRKGDHIDCSDEDGGGYGIVTGVNVDNPELVIVLRWADGTEPSPPAADGETPVPPNEGLPRAASSCPRCEADQWSASCWNCGHELPAPSAVPVPPHDELVSCGHDYGDGSRCGNYRPCHLHPAPSAVPVPPKRTMAEHYATGTGDPEPWAVPVPPQPDEDGWVRNTADNAWVCPVGDGSVDLELFDDEMADCPPLVALRRWKAEATQVISDWERLHVALGSPGRLGGSKAAASLAEVQRRLDAAPVERPEPLTVDALAQIIRTVDGDHTLGAGALAEALLPHLTAAPVEQERREDRAGFAGTDRDLHPRWGDGTPMLCGQEVEFDMGILDGECAGQMVDAILGSVESDEVEVWWGDDCDAQIHPTEIRRRPLAAVPDSTPETEGGECARCGGKGYEPSPEGFARIGAPSCLACNGSGRKS